MAKSITVSVISELTTDQRVIRICTTLQEMGFRVLVYARAFNDSMPLGDYPFAAKRIKCIFRKGVLQYAEFNIKLFFKLLFTKTDYLLSNDLDTLAPNYIISRLKGKKIFYDSHEFFTGVYELQDAPAKRKIWQWIEKKLLPRLPVMYTVNDSIKKLYEATYQLKDIRVVRNMPQEISFTPLAMPDKWTGKKILVLQGIGIHHGRGGLEVLEIMSHLPANYYLLIIGGGLAWEEMKQRMADLNITGKVEMIPKVPPEKLRALTHLAHLGLSLDRPVSINNELSLPNKIFDYMQAGIPVAATPMVEVQKIIEQYSCGFCFKHQDTRQMALEIRNVLENDTVFGTMKSNAIAAAKELCWKKEKQKIIDIYTPYL